MIRSRAPSSDLIESSQATPRVRTHERNEQRIGDTGERAQHEGDEYAVASSLQRKAQQAPRGRRVVWLPSLLVVPCSMADLPHFLITISMRPTQEEKPLQGMPRSVQNRIILSDCTICQDDSL